jgi:hypothetical protein
MSSQLGQDAIVDRFLKGQRNGYFVDLGACWFDNMNNSIFFEKERGWKGIAIEYDDKFTPGWKEHRPNTMHIVQDATTVDYQKLFDDYGMPKMIDYLSIDLEPPEVTLQCLYKVLEADYDYKVISFEVDYYRNTEVRDTSRKLLWHCGYVLTGEVLDRGYHIDDMWVHHSIYEEGMKV